MTLVRTILDSVFNLTLIIPFAAWVTAQIIKMLGGCIRQRRWDWSFFIRSGGMPSAHTATIAKILLLIDKFSFHKRAVL